MAKNQITLQTAHQLLKNNDPKPVIRWAQSSLKRAPDDIMIREVYARALWMNNQDAILLDQLAILIEQNPYEPGYHELRGAALERLGFSGAAVQAHSRSKAPQAAERIAVLEATQREQMATLIASNVTAKLAFQQDSSEACRQYGFAFTNVEPKRRREAAREVALRPLDWKRPS